MELMHWKQWRRLCVGAMALRHISQVVMNVITLKGPILVALSPIIIVAEVECKGECGLGGGEAVC